MLKKIKKIKNFGIFNDYVDHPRIPEFKKYNVIYGENGSGKTTLTRLFASLEAGINEYNSDFEYTIQTINGTLTESVKSKTKIRVFNTDYIQNSIGDFEGPLSHILILGKENKEIAIELEAEIKLENSRQTKIDEIKKDIDSLKSKKSSIFTQTATTIGEALYGTASRGYQKPQAEADFYKLTETIPLNENDLHGYSKSIRQEKKPEINKDAFLFLEKEINGKKLLDFLENLAERTLNFLDRTAESSIIERLRDNPDISDWVEKGLILHKHDGQKNCEFCNQPLPPDRIKLLASYFSKADLDFKIEIETEIELIERAKKQILDIELKDPQLLYSELQNSYEISFHKYQNEKNKLITQIVTIKNALIEKLNRRTSSYSKSLFLNTKFFIQTVTDIENLVDLHNSKSINFKEEQDKASKEIKRFYLSNIKEEVNQIDEKLNKLGLETSELINGSKYLTDPRSINEIKKSIEEKRSQISNAHAAGQMLSDNLQIFLGRNDLRFQNSDEGYLVFRKDLPAVRLSEGEKTAIAFLHFLTHLNEQNFDINNGIVVIDDPISSLDSTSMFQAFSFLKNKTKNAMQLFILTHNFNFLNMILKWFAFRIYKDQTTYLMILCEEKDGIRSSQINEIDKLLKGYRTEYCYLFKLLYKFDSNGTIEGSYNMPNVGRKVLESFFDFYNPSSEALIAQMKRTGFDEIKCDAIDQFVNTLSHRTGNTFNPALVAESKKSVKYILELIRTLAPVHYENLKILADA